MPISTRNAMTSPYTFVRWLVILVLFGYFSSRVRIAYHKLKEEKIGTLFNRITSATVKVHSK